MSTWLHPIVIIVCTILGTTGFYEFIDRRLSAKKAQTRLLMGLTYDRLMGLGISYIERGEITRDEFDEYNKYFYKPYKDMGGNGTAERMWEQVRALPFCAHGRHEAIFQNYEEMRTIANVTVIPRTRQEVGTRPE